MEFNKNNIKIYLRRILEVLIIGYFYFFLVAMGVALGDSCGKFCGIIGWVWLVAAVFMLISFAVGVFFKIFFLNIFNEILARKKWLVIFLPTYAIPIYFLSMLFTAWVFLGF